MGRAFDDPLAATLQSYTSDKSYWEEPHEEQDRDTRNLQHARAKASGREAMVPAQLMNRVDVWGGGLRRMTDGGVGPRREDEHYLAPRHTPIGFGRYVDPTLDPSDYQFYHLSGWRVAIPRTVSGPDVRATLLRIYQYGPSSAGYARLGDTIVPAILGPGDRQTLAGVGLRRGAASQNYPMS
jgi:hypothetical protein